MNTQEYFKQFTIPFSGLKEGLHDFHFEIRTPFFAEFSFSEVKGAKLQLHLKLEKQERMLIFDFDFNGTLEFLCDRCTENVALPFNTQKTLYIKFGEAYSEEAEDVIIIPEESYEFDISHYIYEFIALNLPTRRIHPEGECDEEMLLRIQNLEKSKKETDKTNVDPRWETLLKIKND